MPDKSNALATYLNDHLAGSVAGLRLAKACRESHSGGIAELEIHEVYKQIVEDQRKLRQMIARLGIHESRISMLMGWLGERLASLKLVPLGNHHDSLAKLQQLEVLLLGVRGKLALWKAIVPLGLLPREEILELQRRANGQIQVIEQLHKRAAFEALRPEFQQAKQNGSVAEAALSHAAAFD